MRLILHGGEADERQRDAEGQLPISLRVLLADGWHACYEYAGTQDGAAHYRYVGVLDPLQHDA